MGINDFEILWKTYENIRSGRLFETVNVVSTNPELTYNIIMGIVAIGGAVLTSKMFLNLFNDALPADERHESKRLRLFAVKQIKKDEDDFGAVHKIVGNGYTESIKQK